MEIRIKHAGTTHTLELERGACPYRRVGALLGIPAARLTIIRAGRKLPPAGDPALADALVPGALYLVSGSVDALPSTVQRYASDASNAAVGTWHMLTWDYFVALLIWLWSTMLSLGRASITFVTSMVIAPDPERRPNVGRAQARAPPMDQPMG